MNFDGKKLLAKPNANTYDIIEALVDITPKAIQQVKPKINELINVTGNTYKDALQVASYIRKNVKYKQDGYENQNIQLPARMFFDTKKADCKSFSLAFVSLMKAAGHEAGYRFASYKKNKIPTHVYNWVLDKNNLLTFDTCLPNLKESPRHTYIKDMNVNYLSAPPIKPDYVKFAAEAKAKGYSDAQIADAIEQMKKIYGGVQTAIDESRANKPGRGKKILLAPVRGAFLLLVKFNARGLAKKLSLTLAKNPSEVKEFWSRLGGNFDTLKGNIDRGKVRDPFFGESAKTRAAGVGYYDNGNEYPYIGKGLSKEEIGIIAGAIAVATPALVAVAKLFKKNNVPEGEGDVVTPDEAANSEPLPEGFVPGDAETTSATGLTTSFKISPVLIGSVFGAGLLIYLLTKKKK